jgi:hypothetical protein
MRSIGTAAQTVTNAAAEKAAAGARPTPDPGPTPRLS